MMILLTNFYNHVFTLASYLAFTVRGGETEERTHDFSHLRMREIFPEIWENHVSMYGLHITVLFWYSSV